MSTDFISLSHVLIDGMANYPSSPRSNLKQVAKVSEQGYDLSVFDSSFHVGTHMDAPGHMIEGGKYIDEIAIEQFIGQAAVFDVQNKMQIDIIDIDITLLADIDIVLFYSGFSANFTSVDYFTSHPVITQALAELLVEKNIKIAGFDFPSPDKAPFEIHKILLGNAVLIIENLTGLQPLIGAGSFQLIAIPPRIHAEGAFVNVIAVIPGS